MVDLDDLSGVEERRGDLREAHHQHRADGEVRRHEAVRVGERLLETVQVSGGEAGRADDGMDAVHGEPWQRHACGIGDREVHGDVDLCVCERPQFGGDGDTVDRRPRRLWVDCGDEFQFGVCMHGVAHRGTHSTGCPDHSDSDHEARLAVIERLTGGISCP